MSSCDYCNQCVGCTCGIVERLDKVVELLEKMQSPSKPENYEQFLSRAESLINKLKEL